MSITRFYYDPFTEFDRLFDDAFTARFQQGNTQGGGDHQVASQRTSDSSWGGILGGMFKPRMDLHENVSSNTVTATFELPGLKKEDVNIEVHNNRLTISGEVKTHFEQKPNTGDSDKKDESTARHDHGYAVRERRYGSFSRTIQLPNGIKHEEIKANMENGVLSVTFPKMSPESAPKKITIGNN